MKAKLITSTLFAVMLTLTACGGGGNGGNNSQANKNTTPVTLSDFASNVWEYTLKEDGKSFDFYMVFSKDGTGKIYNYNVENSCYLHSSINITKENDHFILTDVDNETHNVTVNEDVLTFTHTEGNTIEKIHWKKSNQESSKLIPLCKS